MKILVVVLAVLVVILWFAVATLVSRLRATEERLEAIGQTIIKYNDGFEAIATIMSNVDFELSLLEKKTKWMDAIDEQFCKIDDEAEI